MKKLSKILALMLAVSMILGTVAYAADFSDVKSENQYYEPIKILSAFGIINGYEDGTFGPDKDVTRAEFSKMLMGAMASAGIGNTDPAGMPFTDMHDPTVAWSVGDIRTAYDLGIINGMTETTFEPKSNVTYEQALKMIVCALNYGGQAESVQAATPGAPWYYGYLQTARGLSLTDDVIILEGQPAKRAHIAQMVYNALEVNMLEKVEIQGGGHMYTESKQNWMKDKLKITKAHGTLLADETDTMAADGTTARPGYALFSDETTNKNITIAKNNISLAGFLGKTVDYYYKTDIYGTNNLVLALGKAGDNASVKVNASNINKITGDYASGYSIEYYESDTATRTKTLVVDANPIISYNGEVRTNVSASQLNIESGSLEFISSGAGYNKINVEAFETWVVKSVNKTDKYVVDVYRQTGANNLYIDETSGNYEISMKNSSGNAITISNLAQYNVLTVKTGKGTSNRTTLDITVSTKTASGSVKELDTDYININGTKYYISAYLEKNGSADINKISVGDSCKAYLDRDGKIAYIEKVASISTFYGYMASAGVTSNDTVRVALISSKTPSMGSPFLELASKVRIDGNSYSDANTILNTLKASAANSAINVDNSESAVYSQLIKYTINSSGKITDIDTVELGSDDANDDTIVKADANNSAATMTYYSSEFSGNGKKFRINSSTQIFLVPADRGDYDSYGRKSSGFFKNDGTTAYTVEAYNVTGSLNTAEAVVVYANAATETKIEGNTPIFIITGISQTTNKEGEPCDKVTGYQISAGGTVTADKTYMTESVGVISNNFTVGDVIMFVTDNKGYIKYRANDTNAFRHLLDVDAAQLNTNTVSIRYNNTTADMYQGLLVGADVDGNKQTFILAKANDPLTAGVESNHKTFESTMKNFFVYDSTKQNNEKIVKDESLDLTSIDCYNDTVVKDDQNNITSAKASKMFIYTYDGSVRMIMIIK